MITNKRFGIYHPKDGMTNDTCTMDMAYEYVISVEAESLVKSVVMGSVFNPEYRALGKRNTRAGDLITDEHKLFMVDHTGGFKRIPASKDLYKEIMSTDEAIIEILSRKHLSQDDIDNLIENSY
jgi:hypothetical protein